MKAPQLSFLAEVPLVCFAPMELRKQLIALALALMIRWNLYWSAPSQLPACEPLYLGAQPNSMKRFLAFLQYNPTGGMNDFVGDFDTVDQAKAALINARDAGGKKAVGWADRWAHIWDSESRDFVWYEWDDDKA